MCRPLGVPMLTGGGRAPGALPCPSASRFPVFSVVLWFVCVVGAVASAALATAIALNRLGVQRIFAYVLVGIVLWTAVLKSGVHATLAGVLLAFCIPLRGAKGDSPLERLEHDLHGPVAFAILPIFAFANAGLSLAGEYSYRIDEPIQIDDNEILMAAYGPLYDILMTSYSLPDGRALSELGSNFYSQHPDFVDADGNKIGVARP